MQLRTRHTFVLVCPLYNFIRDKFISLYVNVSLDNLKSFFWLDHYIDINLCLMEATTLYSFEGIKLPNTILMYF